MFFIGINAEIEKLSDDMHLVAENLVWKEIFAIFPMGPHGAPWDFDFFNGAPWATHAKLWFKNILTNEIYKPIEYSLNFWILVLKVTRSGHGCFMKKKLLKKLFPPELNPLLHVHGIIKNPNDILAHQRHAKQPKLDINHQPIHHPTRWESKTERIITLFVSRYIYYFYILQSQACSSFDKLFRQKEWV